MASFCTKCGAALSSDERFCTSCGTPVAAAGTAAAPPPPAPQYSQPYAPPVPQYQQPYGQPPPPPASSGGGALKIILIIVGVIVGLGVLGVALIGFTAWRVARSVHLEGNGKDGKVTLSTPGGTFSANTNETFTASDLGVDLYPGAQSVHGGARVSMPTGSMISAIFATSDSKDQVVAFYKQKLGSDVSVYDSGTGAVVTVNKGQEESIIVTVSPNSSQDGGKTRISIVHSKSNKAS